MIFTTSFFRNPYPDEKYSGASLQTFQNGSNIQDLCIDALWAF